jgi:hypothetical protein
MMFVIPSAVTAIGKRPIPASLIAVVAVSAVVAFMILTRAGARVEAPSSALRVERLEVDASVVSSASPLVVRGVLRNAGGSAMHSVFVVGSASTDWSPGTQPRFASEGGIRGLPLLAPGAELPFQVTVVFTGDGWVRAGVMAWSAEETLLPATKRVLVVQPVLSAVELVTLLGLFAAILASVLALLGLLRRARTTPAGRGGFPVALGLGALGSATWIIAASNVQTLDPAVLRLMTYLGIALVGAAWVVLGRYVTSVRGLRGVALLSGLFVAVGAFWIASFSIWQGLRPTAIASTSQLWIEVLFWPLHLAQALFGLRFV